MNDDRRRSSATTSSVVAEAGSTTLLIDHLARCQASSKARSPASVDRSSTNVSSGVYRSFTMAAELPTNEPGSTLQRIHRLPRHMPIPNDGDEHLALHHVARDFSPSDGDKPNPRILELLGNNLRHSPLQLMIDPSHPLLLHDNDRVAAGRCVAARGRLRRCEGRMPRAAPKRVLIFPRRKNQNVPRAAMHVPPQPSHDHPQAGCSSAGTSSEL